MTLHVPQKTARRRRIGAAPRQKHHGAAFRKHRCESLVAHIEPARIGPESRHHQALTVRCETSGPEATPTACDRRTGMEMASDLPWRWRWAGFVAQDQPRRHKLCCGAAAQIDGRIGVMVAPDPDKIRDRRQPPDSGGVGRIKPLGRGAIMKTVA